MIVPHIHVVSMHKLVYTLVCDITVSVMNINVDRYDRAVVPVNERLPGPTISLVNQFVDPQDQLVHWRIPVQALVTLADATTYDGVRLCGEQISFLGFQSGELPRSIVPVVYTALDGFNVARHMVAALTHIFDICDDGQVTTFLLKCLRWATDLNEAEVFSAIQTMHAAQVLRPMAILSMLGFDGAVLRLLGLMNRIIRPYHPPWWHHSINTPATRIGNPDFYRNFNAFPGQFVLYLNDLFGMSNGPLPAYTYELWVQHYRPFLAPSGLQIRWIMTPHGSCNILIFNNGVALLPAHLFHVSQSYSITCNCGNRVRLLNNARTPCCNITAQDVLAATAELVINDSVQAVNIDNIPTDVVVMATIGDLALCLVRGVTLNELQLRSALPISSVSCVNPDSYHGEAMLYCNAGMLHVPVWGYVGVTGFLRTISGALGQCGAVLAMQRPADMDIRVVAVNVSAFVLDNVSDWRTIPRVLMDLLTDANIASANQRLR